MSIHAKVIVGTLLGAQATCVVIMANRLDGSPCEQPKRLRSRHVHARLLESILSTAGGWAPSRP
jgi:hypothetical protein